MVYFVMEFIYFFEKVVLVIGKKGMMGYMCVFDVCFGGKEDFVVCVEVFIIIFCFCFKEIVEYGVYNQCGFVKFNVCFFELIWFEEFIVLVEDLGSCVFYLVFKCFDEKWVIERVYENFRFVEDVSWEVVVRLCEDQCVSWFLFEVENFELIYVYNVYVVIEDYIE